MNLLERLQNNKGTVSSALGKVLANRALAGEWEIFLACVKYSVFEKEDPTMKSVRSGAAKVVEIVAEKKPTAAAKHLEALLPALGVAEPQTRWMIIRTMGFCASANERVARKAIPFAARYIEEKEGLCIASSADLFLGDYGALSKKNAKAVFPLLITSIQSCITNEQDWILEALSKLYSNLGEKEKRIARKFAEKWSTSPRKSTQKRALEIQKLE